MRKKECWESSSCHNCSSHQQGKLQDALIRRLHAKTHMEWQVWAAWQAGRPCLHRCPVSGTDSGGSGGSISRSSEKTLPGRAPSLPMCTPIRLSHGLHGQAALELAAEWRLETKAALLSCWCRSDRRRRDPCTHAIDATWLS